MQFAASNNADDRLMSASLIYYMEQTLLGLCHILLSNFPFIGAKLLKHFIQIYSSHDKESERPRSKSSSTGSTDSPVIGINSDDLDKILII